MSYAIFERVAMPLVIFISVTAAGLLLRAWGMNILARLSRITKTAVDDIVLQAVRWPSVFWIAAIGLYVALGTSELPKDAIGYAFKLLHVLVILSVTLVAANLASRIAIYSIQKAEIPIQATGLTQGVIKVFVITTGVLILMETLGISVTPVLTALGVGGLAVALALQDTLGNLFAGVHVLMEKSVRVGDFIKLETGQEGYVVDIGWRSTRLRMLPNNVVIIPNAKLAQSVVTNFYLPQQPMSLQIPVSVSYASDPEQVERVLVEEATACAKEITGMLSEPAPFVRFIPGFGQSSLDFTLICQVKEFTDQYLAQHELRKRIFKRFKQEGIEIPFPTRTVYVKRNEPAR
ncbi:MAG TPA: mechanosensitive ion channel family protein [Nitrospiria bacterium]|jgi:small-conductance mechanosensitive channel|nr:mechanosensitive ion channel family protein [Nitrospiria bacterium]